jgi:hypothetical protein
LCLLEPELETRVWAYLGGVAQAHHLTALQVGGVEAHLHVLVLAPLT